MFAVPWIAIFLASLATWSSAFRSLSLGLLVVGYCAALANGLLSLAATVTVALLLCAAYAILQHRKPQIQYIGHALFVALAVALSMHWLPGFHNLRVIGPEHLTANAVPFTMYLNLDKPLIGFWLILVLPWIRSEQGWRAFLKAGAGSMLVTTAGCLLIALLMGLVVWEPKWPSTAWLWLLNNLLLVSFAEEAFFRGYVQGGLRRLFTQRSYANAIPIVLSAVLFGLAHAAGGWQWIVLGSVAGLGCGFAYRFGGLKAAILAHFGLNVTHFFLFTYPMLQ